jgi:hypothetical protein
MSASCCIFVPGVCCCASQLMANSQPCYCSVGSPCIGVPSQTPGSNPNTTTTPSSQAGFFGQLGNVGIGWIKSLSSASTAPGSQLQRKVYGPSAFQSLTSNGLFLIVVVLGALVFFFRGR